MREIITNPIFIQILGFVGLLFYALSYQIRENRKLFLAQFVGNLVFAVQFLLLGGGAGALERVVCMVRNIVLAKMSTSAWARWKGWVVIFSLLFIGAGMLTWTGPKDLLPIIACVSCTVAYWTDNARNIRVINLFCASPCWMTYDIIVGSMGGLANELITITSVIISIIRYGWKALGEPQKER